MKKKFEPSIKFEDNCKKWYLNNKLHRTNGPAIECENGDKYWYLNGKLIKQSKQSKPKE